MKKIDLPGAWKMAAAAYNVIGQPHMSKPVRGALVISFDQSALFYPDQDAMDYIPAEGRNPFPIAEVTPLRHPLAHQYTIPYEITGWRLVSSARNHFGSLDVNERSTYGAVLTYFDSPYEEFVPGYNAEEFLPEPGSNMQSLRVDMSTQTRIERKAAANEQIMAQRVENNRSRFLDNDNTPAMRAAREYMGLAKG